MKTTLVIMAAGLGSRYGGNKQTEGIGPNHEMLMEYSIFDAVRAGFSKFVFVIKPEMRPLIEALCGDLVSTRKDRDGNAVEVCYAIQDYSSLPDFFQVPAERTISPEVLGITDPLTVQIRVASFKVGTGELTVDEAIQMYGSFE